MMRRDAATCYVATDDGIVVPPVPCDCLWQPMGCTLFELYELYIYDLYIEIVSIYIV